MIQHCAGQSQYLQNIKKKEKSVFSLNKSFHLGHSLRKTFQNRSHTTLGMQRSSHPCMQPTQTPLCHARTRPPAAPRAADLIRFRLIRFVPTRSPPQDARSRHPGHAPWGRDHLVTTPPGPRDRCREVGERSRRRARAGSRGLPQRQQQRPQLGARSGLLRAHTPQLLDVTVFF